MYFSVLILGLVHCAQSAVSPRSSLPFIRSHTRLLIQSVVNSRAFQEFDDYKSEDRSNGKFCQASSSLLPFSGPSSGLFGSGGSDVVTLKLFKDHMGSVKSITDSAKTLLTSLSDESRLDDIRRANDFNAVWESTIIAELEDIRRALGELEGHNAANSKRANRLGEKATDEHPEESLAVINAIYALDAESHTLKGKEKRDANDKLAGSKSFSKASWTQLESDHKAAEEAFKRTKNTIQTDLKIPAQAVLRTHLDMVQTWKDYMLQLTGELPTYSKGSRTQSDALPQEESTFGANALRLMALIEKDDSQSREGRYSEFESFINKREDEPSHVSQLTKLMTTLNILQIRRLGLQDAQTSLEALAKEVKEAIAVQTNAVSEELRSIKSKLGSDDFTKLSKTVYIDSIKLPGVEIVGVPVSDVDHLDTHMSTLAEKVGKDANGEFIPQLNLIVNVLWRLHAHVLGFVDTYTPSTQGGEAVVPLTDRKAGADCLLYGRVDALMRRLKLENGSETEVCPEDFQNKGIAKMTEAKLTHKQLKDELLSREQNSSAQKPSIENSDSQTGGDTTELERFTDESRKEVTGDNTEAETWKGGDESGGQVERQHRDSESESVQTQEQTENNRNEQTQRNGKEASGTL